MKSSNKTVNKSLFFRYLATILVCTCLLLSPILGQKTYKVATANKKIEIKGTSNLHDWESSSDQVNGDMTANIEGGILKQIKNVAVKFPVSAIKSGKSLMDSKTMDALQSVKFPWISFQSSAISIQPNNVIIAAGQLTIAGVTKGITVSANYSLQKDESVLMKGNVKLKMTDYGVKPPTAMMGMLTTGDEVTISFEVLFKP
jgi:polyisoprenoid-binding protein YceI